MVTSQCHVTPASSISYPHAHVYTDIMIDICSVSRPKTLPINGRFFSGAVQVLPDEWQNSHRKHVDFP